MSTRSASLEFDEELRARIDARYRRFSESERSVELDPAEEARRVADHPGIFFQDGPTGRRAAVRGTGLDVWQIVDTVQGGAGSQDDAIDELATSLELTPAQIRVALRYYASYPEEIDAQVRLNDDLAAELEMAWLRQQGLPTR
jgi:uncharacterized protein (DUF433 family)